MSMTPEEALGALLFHRERDVIVSEIAAWLAANHKTPAEFDVKHDRIPLIVARHGKVTCGEAPGRLAGYVKEANNQIEALMAQIPTVYVSASGGVIQDTVSSGIAHIVTCDFDEAAEDEPSSTAEDILKGQLLVADPSGVKLAVANIEDAFPSGSGPKP